MATVTKDFRVKSGLVVEGTTGTINGSNILTEASTTFLEDYVKDAAGGLLANATLTNIQVSYDSNNNALSLTAENGVADSTTDELGEGSLNLYFTVDRAQDAAAALFEGNHNGIEFSYDDVAGTITATVTGASVPTFSTGIVFEGGAPDNFETTLAVAEPTQDNTITLKDASGTIAFESDVTTAENNAKSYTDTLIGDATVTGIQGNTVEQRIAQARQDAIDTASGIAQGYADQAEADANTYTNGEIVSALNIAQGYADAAELDAKNYTDGEITTALGIAQGYADQAELDAVASAGSYTDGKISQEIIDRDSAILLAKNDAIADAASDATTKANAAEFNAKAYTDIEIADEATRADAYADSVALTAEQNAKNYADGLSSGLTWKKAVNLLWNDSNAGLTGATGTLLIDGHAALTPSNNEYRILITSGTNAGIWEYSDDGANWTLYRTVDTDTFAELIGAAVFVMEGTNFGSTSWVQSNHYLTNFTGQTWSQFSGQGTYLAGNGLALDGTTFEIDEAVTATRTYAEGVATTAENNAKAYTDTRETAITAAYEGYADGVALTAEQNANNYTDGKISTEVSDRNTAITNAIDALSTTDIEEGTRLYFTDARAVDALEAVVPNFTEVDINSVAKQIAATSSVTLAGQAVGYAFAKADYRSAEFLVKVAYSTHTEVSKVILTLDSTDNIAITEYAVVGTNGSASTISAGINGGSVELLVTTAHNASTITVSGTLLA